MASPRVFVSSTFYDLRHVRSDLFRFITDMGYEPVLHERGSIPYGGDASPEESCYREIELCDILVSIIGSRFGSRSKDADHSISQAELKVAHQKGKQVYVFVEKSVLHEFQTYQLNYSVEGIKYASVDDVRIFQFLAEVTALPKNNAIAPFENTNDIISYLRSQWAGLFQRVLANSGAAEERQTIDKLKASVSTLEQLVTLLVDNQKSHTGEVREILLVNHPAFGAVRRALRVPFRVSFYNFADLAELLAAYHYSEHEVEKEAEMHAWRLYATTSDKKIERTKIFRISTKLFDSNNVLVAMNLSDWSDTLVTFEELSGYHPGDDIPF